MLGNLQDFLNTSAITDLSFLGSQEDGYPDSELNSPFKLASKAKFLTETNIFLIGVGVLRLFFHCEVELMKIYCFPSSP